MQNRKVQDIWDIFVITGIQWSEIRTLPDEDFNFLLDKAIEAKQKTLEQEKRRQEYLAKLEKLEAEGKLPEGYGQGQ
jgi:hypothetical protein